MINLGADGVFVTVAFDYWITSRGRALSLAEMARFQGVDKCGVSRTQFASMRHIDGHDESAQECHLINPFGLRLCVVFSQH